MHSTVIDRRGFLLAAAGMLCAPGIPAQAAGAAGRICVGAYADESGAFGLAGFDASGRAVLDVALPSRGHSFAVAPAGNRVVAFGRRPSRAAWVVDRGRHGIVHRIESPANRHFYGHGTFSPDGRRLYATENDFEAGRGVIGVYDAPDGFRRVTEFPTHGTGPHELRMTGDGTTLVVANGGIRTHPDMPRVKLNVPTMQPSLVYMDRRDGQLLERVQLAPSLHRLSIRHLDTGAGDVVAVAMQDAGPRGRVLPLVALHRRGQALELLDAPASSLRAMRQYCGSVAFDAAGVLVAVSAPRGGLLTFWDSRTGSLVSTAAVADGCGVAAAREPGVFVAGSGEGGLYRVDARNGSVTPLPAAAAGLRWDNHLVVLEAGRQAPGGVSAAAGGRRG